MQELVLILKLLPLINRKQNSDIILSMENISLKQNLKESWALFKINYKLLVSVTLILGVASVLGQTKIAILALVAFVLNIILQMGSMKISLDILDKKETDIKTLISQKDKFFKYFLMIIFVSIFVTAPLAIVSALVLFKAPMLSPFVIVILILAILFVLIPRLMFANMVIVDTDQTAWQSIKTSYFITKQHTTKTILLFLMVVGINILGALLLGIGLLASIPVSQLIIAKYYRQISGKIMPVVEELPIEIVEIETVESKVVETGSKSE